MNNKLEDRILGAINTHEIIELLSDFVKIPSISGEEARLAAYEADICSKIGLDTKIDSHGNVIAVLKGNKPGPRIALNSHLDTVGFGEGWSKDPVGAEIEGDRLYGRGSADCKASMVAHLIATKALIEAKADLSGEIVITHVVEEEVQNTARKGTVRMIKDGFQADMAINGEATDLNICVACEGMLEVKINTLGLRAHGSTPEKGINAISQMCKVINEISKLQPGYNKYTGYGSIVPGVIKGGERSSVVPDECELRVSRFIVPGENGPMFYSQILGIIERLKIADEKFNARAELVYNSNPSLISEDEIVVQRMIDAHKYIGLPYTVSGTPQHDDADYLVNMANIPTVIYGPGHGKIAHMPDEYVLIPDVVTAAKVYALTMFYALRG
ncbi:MAG: M20/M25/M40 family metallo-hydrolase [Peptococcaceae bacterium]|nr:M20/M25/M40 family metallo-hydrolase [Peptococcaceae bacterium]MDH7526051.1 M20/M25/M40 family metallo-hydrolase [Peptococcaceae bacterium]